MLIPPLASVSCSTCSLICSSVTHPGAPGEWFSRTHSLQVQENHLTFQTQSLSCAPLLPTGGLRGSTGGTGQVVSVERRYSSQIPKA